MAIAPLLSKVLCTAEKVNQSGALEEAVALWIQKHEDLKRAVTNANRSQFQHKLLLPSTHALELHAQQNCEIFETSAIANESGT